MRTYNTIPYTVSYRTVQSGQSSGRRWSAPKCCYVTYVQLALRNRKSVTLQIVKSLLFTVVEHLSLPPFTFQTSPMCHRRTQGPRLKTSHADLRYRDDSFNRVIANQLDCDELERRSSILHSFLSCHSKRLALHRALFLTMPPVTHCVLTLLSADQPGDRPSRWHTILAINILHQIHHF